ncbi:HAD family hydrolase [Luteolibacter luteus]|uniref:HAD family hydrolase n=1 Tax=Luteolibacter luteus TaxID=2728835 RepID=A0A858RCB5_9BACT|nr:HAD family hydrolase [Luteolibacter luteus]QJE94244.1 HAD family hydrolase [Luteolibacter luteus]
MNEARNDHFGGHHPLTGIKAILFDIYGTLLGSTAGEIHPDPELRALIAEAHARSPHPFPEVEIREIHALRHPGLPVEEIEALALRHERSVNPVEAMPGASETLHALKARGLPLGLVSNAQFYTLPELERCLGPIDTLGIDPGLCFFSYEHLRAKPDPFLFELAKGRLLERGIHATETLYIGNDVRNDIDPAARTGFRTALFAGDARSLRLRGRRLDNSGADHIITELRQLLE